MRHNLCILFLFQLVLTPALAQMMYPVVGQYKSRSAQGMAILDDDAYLFNDGGLCRVLNLKTGKIEHNFMLECAAKETHVNSACFSRQYIGDIPTPALYVTEFYGKRRCFVELIDGGKSRLIQTIEFKDSQGRNPFVREWIVDNKEQMLYAVIREANKENSNVIKKFALPLLSDPKVLLTDKDIVDEFTVYFVNGLQGGKIKGRYMYITVGFTPLHGEGEYFDRAIKVIDLRKKRLVRSIDLSKVTINEPEDIDFYKGKCLLFAGGTGGIYKAF